MAREGFKELRTPILVPLVSGELGVDRFPQPFIKGEVEDAAFDPFDDKSSDFLGALLGCVVGTSEPGALS